MIDIQDILIDSEEGYWEDGRFWVPLVGVAHD